MLPAGGLAGRRVREQSARRPPGASAVGGRHSTAGQYGYVPLGRHLIKHLVSILCQPYVSTAVGRNHAERL